MYACKKFLVSQTDKEMKPNIKHCAFYPLRATFKEHIVDSGGR